jgi:predicted dinucleotide-binding enzyme
VLTRAGHEVRVANSRGPETLAELAAETGATASTVADAVADAELVVVTIPMRAVPDLDRGLFEAIPASVPIVDTNNYYPRNRDGKIPAIEDEGLAESEWVARTLGHPVVKAFNNIYAAHIVSAGRPEGDPERIALPVAGDDPATKRIVMAVVEQLGFDAVDAGPLGESWRQQPGSAVYGTDLQTDALRAALDAEPPGRSDDWRA